MRILYYSPHPNLRLSSNTGYGTHMREMIAAFSSANTEVETLIAGDWMAGTPDTAIASETPIHENNEKKSLKQVFKYLIPNSLWSTIKDANLLRHDRKIKKILMSKVDEWKPDIIYERCNYLQLSGAEVAASRHIPHILEVNSPYVDERVFLEKSYNFFTTLAKQNEKRQAFMTTMLVVVSSALKNYYNTVLKVPDEKIVVIPNAINPNNGHLIREEDQNIRRSFGLQGKTVFGFVGSFFRWHGIDIMMKAFNEIDDPNTMLLIIGSGEIEDELKNLAQTLDRKNDIIFAGEVNHDVVYDYISAMDICVLARSHWYGSPVKLFEYGAMGKAIIAPDNIPVKDIMVNGKDGILVKPTVRSLRDAMVYMLENPEEAKKMSEHFNQKVMNEYTWTNHARRILDSLQTVLKTSSYQTYKEFAE